MLPVNYSVHRKKITAYPSSTIVDFIFHLIHHYLFPVIVLVCAMQEILWAFEANGNDPSKNYANKWQRRADDYSKC